MNGKMTLGDFRHLARGLPDETEIDLGPSEECTGLAWGGFTPAQPCVDDESVMEPPRITLSPTSQ